MFCKGEVNPVCGCFASLSMTSVVSFRALFFVIPSESEESSMDASLRLRFAQHDKRGVIPSALFCHSERSEESSMDASLRLRSVQHDKVVSFRTLFFVIPSAVRNPVHGCFASLSMTSVVSFRTLFFVIPSAVRNPVHGCFASPSTTG